MGPIQEEGQLDSEGTVCFNKYADLFEPLLSSSMVEHSAVNRRVAGSSPA